MPDAETWDCEAYGPEGREVGALCFVSPELGQRRCGSRAECELTVDSERHRVFGRIRDLAAAGDPTGVFLAQEFSSPAQLLGGEHAGEGLDGR